MNEISSVLAPDLKSNLPKRPNPEQLWIFFTDEAPYHTFMADRSLSMKSLNGLFNLSMTYRSDSDIPVPYGEFFNSILTELRISIP